MEKLFEFGETVNDNTFTDIKKETEKLILDAEFLKL